MTVNGPRIDIPPLPRLRSSSTTFTARCPTTRERFSTRSTPSSTIANLTDNVPLACAKPEDCEAIRTEPWVRDYLAFQSIHDLLSAGTPPAELRANLYRALALVPGIENDGTGKDAAGRDAVAIAWNQEPYAPEFTRRTQILFATNDAAYLGSRVSDQAIVRGSKIIGETAQLQAKIVSDVGER